MQGKNSYSFEEEEKKMQINFLGLTFADNKKKRSKERPKYSN